jgi:hypothetical protein
MRSILNNKDVKSEKVPSSSAQGEKALGFLLNQVQRWQRKASTHPEEIKQSVQALQSLVQEKTGQTPGVPKMSAEELVAFVMNPAHFNEKERNLVRSLFNEVLRLRKKMDQGGRISKGKKRNKSFV